MNGFQTCIQLSKVYTALEDFFNFFLFESKDKKKQCNKLSVYTQLYVSCIQAQTMQMMYNVVAKN